MSTLEYTSSLEFEKNNKIYEDFLKKMKSTQDYKKIVQNLLDGKKYIEFQFKFYNEVYLSGNFKGEKSLILNVRLRNTVTNIKDFSLNSIYLPFIDSFKIEDYINKYQELKVFKILKTSYNDIIIDLKETLNNFNTFEFDSISHNLKIKNNEIRNKFKEDYKIINDFIKDNNTSKKENPFFLNFDFKRKILRLEKVNDITLFENLDVIFYLENNIDDLRNIHPFSVLHFKYKNSDIVIDIEKSLEKIQLFKNMSNF